MFGQLGSSRPLFVFGWDREFKIFWLICLVSICGLCVKGIFENVHGHCVQTPRHSLTYVMHQHKSRILTWIPQTYCKLFWTSTWKSVIDAKAWLQRETCSEQSDGIQNWHEKGKSPRIKDWMSNKLWANAGSIWNFDQAWCSVACSIALECWEIWEKLSALPPCSSLRSHPGQFHLALPTQLGLWKNWLNFIGYAIYIHIYIYAVNLSTFPNMYQNQLPLSDFVNQAPALKGYFPVTKPKQRTPRAQTSTC